MSDKDAPAPEPVAWMTVTPMTKALSFEPVRDPEATHIPLYASPPADARDAARYRWLRSASVDRGCIPYDDWWELLGDNLDEDFDAAIDAAIKGKQA